MRLNLPPLLLFTIFASACSLLGDDQHDYQRWEGAIAQFEKRAKDDPPKKNGVLFVGSSSIRMWKLDQWFPDAGYINHGFGGSEIVDSTHFAERIIFPFEPRIIVMYAGDNDIAKGRSPVDVASDFSKFVKKTHAKLPKTKIVFVAIKPSTKRWNLIDKVRDANSRIQKQTEKNELLEFLDIDKPMIGDDGKPRKELFIADGLHLSEAGYKIWVELLKPHLKSAPKKTDQSADFILKNGKIVTVDKVNTIARAIAVADGKIIALGDNETVLQQADESTEIVDLKGAMVLPGLMDSHTHPTGASMHDFDHVKPPMNSIADVLSYIRDRTKVVKEGDWIQLSQVFITRLKEQRYPTRAELDEAAPKHPVVFSTGPDASVNSLALKVSGIDKDFQTTGSGAVEKDSRTGEPTGILRGGAKRHLKITSGESKKATQKDRQERLKKLFASYNANGITAIADRNASSSALRLYAELLSENELTVRVRCSHSFSGGGDIEAIQKRLNEIAAHPLRKPNDMLQIVGIKMFQDGGMLTGSAAMRKPWGVSEIYSIRDPEYKGVLFIEKEKLNKIVAATIAAGLQFTAHSVGDQAVHNLVEAYAAAAENGDITSTRPCITHCNFMSKEAVENMARLGVVADIQPAWLYLDGRTLTKQFGEKRLRYFQPLASIFAAGGIAGGGSDHMQKIDPINAINPYHPFLGMWITLNRVPRGMTSPLHEQEALTRQQAIRFYTANNAYLMFLDHVAGSLEVGKAADMILLDRDLLNCSLDEVRETKVRKTWLGGKVVFARG